ncbi:two-component sensor histidine kinase [Microbacterium maritypicum]|uniref:histidine kinase n=1 Tax=Microbacterium maritypicum TaxID=33918 RepID=A0A4Y4B9J0_MICMQ|nr:two-component sensor histidine kinase [Microbacterium liquefaciens]GGV65665.1 two-component sensor histidine kinase [Microbacterium liquefaciens]
MAFDQSTRGSADTLRLTRGEKLSAIERIVVLVIVTITVATDLIGFFTTPGVNPVALLVSVASTAAFVLYLWKPLIATCALGVVFASSFLTGSELQVLAAAAVAAGFVMRLGWTSLILSYTGVFLVAAAIVANGDADSGVNVALYLIFATVAGAVGFALRLAFARGSRLERELEERAEQERQAVLAERRWIAGELHDSIAHHLTVVALHVQMLEDPETSNDSQEAIRVAARKAMTDLRFVIELADDGPQSSSVQTGDLAAAIDEAQGEFESAGHSVAREGDPRDERIPRAVEIVLARIVRESATNILKYAGPGEVQIDLAVDDEVAHLTLRSPLPTTPRRELSSSRTGLGRMAERVMGASGEFSADEIDGFWVVSARLPVV